MAFVEPPRGRAKIVDLGDRVHIEIPLRPRSTSGWLQLLFLLGFLIAWVSAGSAAIWFGLIEPPEKNNPPLLPLLFMLGWTVVWAISTLFLGGWCWQTLVGREEVEVTSQELTVWLRPFGRKLRYRLSDVKNLRVLEDVFASFGEQTRWWMWWFPSQGVLAFDYGASTVRFGTNLDPAEARQIVALIKERFGQYMKEDS